MYNETIMVIDTETYGGFKHPQLLEVGYCLIDIDEENKKFRIFHKMDKYIRNRIDLISEEEFIYKNLDKIKKNADALTLKDTIKDLNENIERVSKIWAYNSRFDKKVLKPFIQDIEIQDIMKVVKEKVKGTENYKFETIYKKIMNDSEYQEEHTALQDAKDEARVFMKVLGYEEV